MALFNRFVLVFMGALFSSCTDRLGETKEGESPVFQEAVLESWGYLTTGIVGDMHEIRSLKNFGSAEERFYARFSLRVYRFKTESDAEEKLLKLKAVRSQGGLGRFKDYREFVKNEAEIYVVRPTSNYTRLEHLPDLLAKIRVHLAGLE